ncbi:SMI1/KNR4 family protein [Clostridium beijerinckii]|uniref:Ribosomal protein S17E n=1 Tax=Clostridium beijerinckii TaxID=1520 RepID=A0AAX0B8W3_CLOBE|nr:SMI1/KNR4 family protein [Clostridium beijerinckii]NRT37138.1 ribosomal protein S17E [Clostridium beijerinckii]NRT43428.1 ribosomal protein S17E [Clostridium beijerinckii]NRT91289.1 ribosomal protein S17E [Clostridium beijerinckii]NRZ22581.1 ribosomal protein S17E [Clostridium beijerinckii]NYC70815.1 ribosomal protein S17E [Clostridium beijerinckii]
MNNEEVLFIKKCFKVLAEKHPEKFEFKKAIDEEKTIQSDMRAENSISRWKLVESNVSENDILRLEEKFNINLPSIYRTFLCTYYHLFEKLEGIFDNFYQENDKIVTMYIVQQPSDSPLSKIEGLFEGYKEIIDFGYIPIGDFNGWGPLCFDVPNNYKLVWLDHEEYYECESREELEDLGETIFDNFEEFMECFFCGKKHECGE